MSESESGRTRLTLDGSIKYLHALSSFQRTGQAPLPEPLFQAPAPTCRTFRPVLGEPSKVTSRRLRCQAHHLQRDSLGDWEAQEGRRNPFRMLPRRTVNLTRPARCSGARRFIDTTDHSRRRQPPPLCNTDEKIITLALAHNEEPSLDRLSRRDLRFLIRNTLIVHVNAAAPDEALRLALRLRHARTRQKLRDRPAAHGRCNGRRGDAPEHLLDLRGVQRADAIREQRLRSRLRVRNGGVAVHESGHFARKRALR